MYFGLDEGASREALRHAILSELRLPSNTSWKEITAEPRVRDALLEALPEAKRKEWVIVWGLPPWNLSPDASWFDIWGTIEAVAREMGK